MNAPKLSPPETGRKMKKPERADYFRVFPAIMLLDDDYADLEREDWGSVFLLAMNQWAKGGVLPEETRKLARIAQCSEEQLAELLTRWPKLKPIEGKPGKVGIPYLVKEYAEVMGFYEEQKVRSDMALAAKQAKAEAEAQMLKDALTHGAPKGHPRVTLQDQDQDQALEQALEQERDKTETYIDTPPAGAEYSGIGSDSKNKKAEPPAVAPKPKASEAPNTPIRCLLPSIKINQPILDFSTDRLNAAISNPWSYVEYSWKTLQEQFEGMPDILTGKSLDTIMNYVDAFSSGDPLWLAKWLVCIAENANKMDVKSGRLFKALGTLFKPSVVSGLLAGEVMWDAAAGLHGKCMVVPTLDDGIISWDILTYNGAYPKPSFNPQNNTMPTRFGKEWRVVDVAFADREEAEEFLTGYYLKGEVKWIPIYPHLGVEE